LKVDSLNFSSTQILHVLVDLHKLNVSSTPSQNTCGRGLNLGWVKVQYQNTLLVYWLYMNTVQRKGLPSTSVYKPNPDIIFVLFIQDRRNIEVIFFFSKFSKEQRVVAIAPRVVETGLQPKKG
jgi:hypothetical protein